MKSFPEARGRILLDSVVLVAVTLRAVYTAPFWENSILLQCEVSLILYFLIGCCLKQQEYILKVHYKATLLELLQNRKGMSQY